MFNGIYFDRNKISFERQKKKIQIEVVSKWKKVTPLPKFSPLQLQATIFLKMSKGG